MGVKVGSKALVLNEQIIKYGAGDEITRLTFAQKIILPTALTTYYNVELSNESGTISSVSQAGPNRFRFNLRQGLRQIAMVNYISEDGRTFTLEDAYPGNVLEFEEPLFITHMDNDILSEFFVNANVDFTGIYTAQPNGESLSWEKQDVGIETTADKVLPGYKVYTNEGVITGTFGQNKTPEENLAVIGLAEDFLHQPTPRYLFQDYQGRKMPIDLRELTFDEPTQYSWMFNQSQLEAVDASALDMSHAVNIAFMFGSMPNLKRLDCSGWELDGDTLTGMNHFCSGNSALEEIVMFNVHPTCQDMHVEGMFSGCSSLRRIDCSGIIVDSISTGGYAGLDSFATSCSSLEFLDISGFTFNSEHLAYRDPFTNVPTDCLIVVRSTTEKNALTSKYPRMTNIKTKAEYTGQEV